jgi:hypothetical protein
METVLELICEVCSVSFNRKRAEHTRNTKKNRRVYCSRQCQGKAGVGNLGKYRGNVDTLQKWHEENPAVPRDRYTGLREHLARAKRRKHTCSITLDDLLTQWNAQGGKCVYTGVELQYPKWKRDSKNNLMYVASLDRIDSSIGYEPGNIQFISASANYAKANMTHQQMLEFCRLIATHWK